MRSLAWTVATLVGMILGAVVAGSIALCSSSLHVANHIADSQISRLRCED